MSSNIEWTDETWNPVVGCTPVSPGCLNCYAATMSNRLQAMGQEQYVGLTVKRDNRHVFNGTVRTIEDRLTEPLGWKKPRRVFVNSMSDLFHESVPFEFIDRVFAVMALCPQHTFQVLTKRPERMAEYLGDVGRLTMIAQEAVLLGYGEESMRMQMPLPNVWLGTSVEDQARADERIPWLLKCPAKVRFLSCEPLLGPVDLRLRREVLTDLMDLDPARSSSHRGQYPIPGAPADARTRRQHALEWVIVGGESGAKARACDVGWIRSIVGQCKDAGVPVFVKQLGAKPYEAKKTCDDCMGTGREQMPCDPDDLRCEFCDGAGEHGGPLRLLNRKGGDMAEWLEDLRVREFPVVEAGMRCGGSAPTPPVKAKTGTA